MGKVAINVSMSLDGFVAGPNVSVEQPMGEGGERLHDWLFNRNSQRGGTANLHTPESDVNAAVVREMMAATGAVILGRRIYDTAVELWGDVPYPVPCFVLTHTKTPERAMASGTFTFVNDGLVSALSQAQTVAGAKKIVLMGINVSQQFLKAGLVDEIHINLVPVLLGKGLRLFEPFGIASVELEKVQVLEAPDVTHLSFRVV